MPDFIEGVARRRANALCGRIGRDQFGALGFELISWHVKSTTKAQDGLYVSLPYAGALVLVTLILIASVLARVATRRLERMHGR